MNQSVVHAELQGMAMFNPDQVVDQVMNRNIYDVVSSLRVNRREAVEVDIVTNPGASGVSVLADETITHVIHNIVSYAPCVARRDPLSVASICRAGRFPRE